MKIGIGRVLGGFAVMGMLVLLSTSAWAAPTGVTGPNKVGVATNGPTFKPSPNVYFSYTPDATTPPVSYTAGTVHSAGDRAYGVDPDYTGMNVKSVTVGTTDPGIPAAVAGSSGDFTGSWTAK